MTVHPDANVHVALWHEEKIKYWTRVRKRLFKAQEAEIQDAQHNLSHHEKIAEAIWKVLEVNLIDSKGQWVR